MTSVSFSDEITECDINLLWNTIDNMFEQGNAEITSSNTNILAFGLGSGLIFLVRTLQEDTFLCFTFLSGIKKLSHSKDSHLQEHYLFKHLLYGKYRTLVLIQLLTLVCSDQFYQFCSRDRDCFWLTVHFHIASLFFLPFLM